MLDIAVVRYIPIPKSIEIPNITITNLNLTTVNISLHQYQHTESTGNALWFNFSAILPYIILTLLIGFIAIVVYMYIRIKEGATSYTIHMGRGIEREPVFLALYTYSGVKMLLRKCYLRIREMFRCGYCTPREIANRHGSMWLKFFASVYEDVVYGSKDRNDVDLAVKCVDAVEQHE